MYVGNLEPVFYVRLFPSFLSQRRLQNPHKRLHYLLGMCPNTNGWARRYANSYCDLTTLPSPHTPTLHFVNIKPSMINEFSNGYWSYLLSTRCRELALTHLWVSISFMYILLNHVWPELASYCCAIVREIRKLKLSHYCSYNFGNHGQNPIFPK
jgi:hypothetical protein